MRKIFRAALAASLLLLSPLSATADGLYDSFVQIPDSQRVAVYWYWMSDNISQDGVRHDLEAMKKAGITRAFIGNIWQDEVKPGNIKVLTPEWWDVMHAALKRATELGIEIGIFNCPGWSQSGGPWIKPSQAMRYLKGEAVQVLGNGKEQAITLPSLGDEATDVRVLAYPATNHYSQTVELHKKQGEDLTVDVDFHSPGQEPLRSITFRTESHLLTNAIIQAHVNGEYQDLKVVHLDRTNTALNVGFHPYAPIVASIPDVKADRFRIILKDGPQDCNLKATLSTEPLVERYEEKSLAKMFQQPLPMWGEYMWGRQPEPSGTAVAQPSDVLDLTSHVRDGVLYWTAPEGTSYTILRTGMVPTGVTNAPASKEATGYEVDKMSRQHVAAHFDAFLGELLRRIPEADRQCFKIVVEDSYETGGQNWTDDMIESFTKRYDYSPVPFIPVLYGQVIKSQDASERFLWDLRRLVADRVAYDYVGGLRDVSHRHGLTTWLECYGHWGFPSEFLMYGGQSDEVAGEFWSEGSLGDIENRAASSCAHIYGKNKVWAESCTAGGPNFSRYPAVMKQRTDRFFCEGINATHLHLFIQQPDDNTLPGVSAPFGNDFQRKNTWFQQMDLFTDYLRRCNLMLQQGSYVADVAYYIGEDTPKMTGECNPALPRGYSFDYINAEVLEKASVQDGQLCLRSGMKYRLLVLPNQRTMRPAVLKRIMMLAGQGLTIVGPKPTSSPSLQDYPRADSKVLIMGNMMWESGKYGQGHIYPEGTDIKSILDSMGILPDCYAKAEYPYSFLHRSLADGEVYFISNQSDREGDFPLTFRQTGLAPQAWNPVTAERLSIANFHDNGSSTSLTLHLAANESMFVVFRKSTEEDTALPAMTLQKTVLASIDTPWHVKFQKEMRGPKQEQTFSSLTDWTQSNDPAIRYYSGMAEYTNTLQLGTLPEGPVYLDLGQVMVMAKVYINNQYAGGAWTAPYRIPVGKFLRKGKNTVRIEVVNNWQNRLIGDQQLPESERPTWTSVNPWNADSQLQSSGLLGPVQLVR